METGKIKWFKKDLGYGFLIADGGGPELYIPSKYLEPVLIDSLVPGLPVRFTRMFTSRGYHAVSISLITPGSPHERPDTPGEHDSALRTIVELSHRRTPDPPLKTAQAHEATDEAMISEDLEELDSTRVARDLLVEMAKWKREAKAEDNDRYFWHVREVDDIARGDRYFVIGRKGSGKTALCEHFLGRREHDVFAEKLSFKNFPWNDLYSQTNTKYTPPNQFITIWKYLVYGTVCRLMLRNEAVPSDVRGQLEILYGGDLSLSRRIDRWVGREFGLSLFGLSFKLSKQADVPAPESWVQYVDLLEDFVRQHAGAATYYVLFDELDEDYRDIIQEEQYLQYTALITSLFKAVQDIRMAMASDGNAPRIFPVIFLRDDIYEIVQDADKNKWGDFRVDLNWDQEKIKKVIAFRISRALNPQSSEALSFDAAWTAVFGKKLIGVGKKGKNRISTFDFIARSTLLRPRDFVAYLQNCAQHAVDEGGSIGPSVVKRVDKAFSNYLRDELTDELFAVLPDVSHVFDVISQLRKWNFSIPEFEQAYSEKVASGVIGERNGKLVLQLLFDFSVIGNTPRTGWYVFRYQNRDARLNFKERVVVHRGLFKALQIL